MIELTISHSIVESEKPTIKKRKPLRLKEYDYSLEGSYFVTICTKDRVGMLGKIIKGVMQPNQCGKIVQSCWEELRNHYPMIMLDGFVVMPNHVHSIIIIIDGAVGAGLRPAPTRDKRYPLSEIIRAFKSFSARRINEMRNTPGVALWQRNYYEHIIRSEKSFQKIQQYVYDNPTSWNVDKENTDRIGEDEFDKWIASEGRQKITNKRDN